MFTIFIILLVLKLSGLVYIDWKWVTAPIWITLIMGLLFYLFAIVILILAYIASILA